MTDPKPGDKFVIDRGEHAIGERLVGPCEVKWCEDGSVRLHVGVLMEESEWTAVFGAVRVSPTDRVMRRFVGRGTEERMST